MRVGDAPRLEHADAVVTDDYENTIPHGGIVHQRLGQGLVDKARAFLAPHLAVPQARHHRWDLADHAALRALGCHGASRIAARAPEQVLVNINADVGYHVDLTAPYPATNAVVTLRDGALGGEVVLPDLRLAFRSLDGWLLAFDGQHHMHGVTPVSGPGYRASLVFYCPT